MPSNGPEVVCKKPRHNTNVVTRQADLLSHRRLSLARTQAPRAWTTQRAEGMLGQSTPRPPSEIPRNATAEKGTRTDSGTLSQGKSDHTVTSLAPCK